MDNKVDVNAERERESDVVQQKTGHGCEKRGRNRFSEAKIALMQTWEKGSSMCNDESLFAYRLVPTPPPRYHRQALQVPERGTTWKFRRDR